MSVIEKASASDHFGHGGIGNVEKQRCRPAHLCDARRHDCGAPLLTVPSIRLPYFPIRRCRLREALLGTDDLAAAVVIHADGDHHDYVLIGSSIESSWVDAVDAEIGMLVAVRRVRDGPLDELAGVALSGPSLKDVMGQDMFRSPYAYCLDRSNTRPTPTIEII